MYDFIGRQEYPDMMDALVFVFKKYQVGGFGVFQWHNLSAKMELLCRITWQSDVVDFENRLYKTGAITSEGGSSAP